MSHHHKKCHGAEIRAHVEAIREKFNLKSNGEAVRLALRLTAHVAEHHPKVEDSKTAADCPALPKQSGDACCPAPEQDNCCPAPKKKCGNGGCGPNGCG